MINVKNYSRDVVTDNKKAKSQSEELGFLYVLFLRRIKYFDGTGYP